MDTQKALKIAQDLERLSALKELDLLDTPVEEAFDRLTRLASKITNSPISLVSIIDAQRQFFKSQVGLSEPESRTRETPLSHSFCKHVIADNTPLIVEDAREHPVLKDNLAIPDLGVIAYLGIPLTTAEGVRLGSFCIIDTSPRKWTVKEIEIMYELASLVMTEIDLRMQIKKRTEAEASLQSYAGDLEETIEERTEELHKVYEWLKQIDQLKSKFIDDISHELRTPITNINLYLDLLIRKSPENRAKYEAILKKESGRLIHLIDDMLDFSNLQKSLDEVNVVTTDLNKLVAQKTAEFEERAHERGLDLTFTPNKGTLPVEVDDIQLKKAVGHLLQNALTYTPAGFVRLSTDYIGDRQIVCLKVQDSGVGMDEEELAHCFDRFYRGKRIGQLNIVTGAGLGLAKVKDIVAFHRGWVVAESEVGRGSTFSIYLPLAG